MINESRSHLIVPLIARICRTFCLHDWGWIGRSFNSCRLWCNLAIVPPFVLWRQSKPPDCTVNSTPSNFLPRGAIMNDRHNVWCGLAISLATMSSDCLISPLLRDQQHARTLPRCSHLTYLTLWAFSNISKYISRKYEPSWRVAAIHFHPIRRHNYT